MRSNRACSLGYGKKADLTMGKSSSPPPNIYKVDQGMINRSSAISFGNDRESVKFGSFM
jgi:hypothetical protein